MCTLLFFFNDTAPTEIYTLSLHDALPTSVASRACAARPSGWPSESWTRRSEEHTSELQSRRDLVCRLLLEKKKITDLPNPYAPMRTVFFFLYLLSSMPFSTDLSPPNFLTP